MMLGVQVFWNSLQKIKASMVSTRGDYATVTRGDMKEVSNRQDERLRDVSY
jgi:hypothetical protein